MTKSDPALLSAIVSNLLGNAVEYARRARRSPAGLHRTGQNLYALDFQTQPTP